MQGEYEGRGGEEGRTERLGEGEDGEERRVHSSHSARASTRVSRAGGAGRTRDNASPQLPLVLHHPVKVAPQSLIL